MSIHIEQLSYEHPDRTLLFKNISFHLQKGMKASLIGDNGSGKSTLIRVLSGKLEASSGSYRTSSTPYYIPQHFGQYDDMSIYRALQIDDKLNALQAILGGDASEHNFKVLNDDWEIEEKVKIAFDKWQIAHINPSNTLQYLSGGEKTKIFLAGIEIHSPEIILLDEPSNHLDYQSRELLQHFLINTSATILLVSHDKALLNIHPHTFELSRCGVKYYSGNYDFYYQQKEIENASALAQLEEKEKELRFAKKIKQEMVEKRQKLDARGRQREVKKGLGKMALNILKDRAEKTTASLKDTHETKTDEIRSDISDMQKGIDHNKLMKVNFNSSKLHKGKILAKATAINHAFGDSNLWKDALSFVIQSGERVLLKGLNGSGKTTLINLLTKKLTATSGELYLADFCYVHLDQEYSMVDNNRTVYEQAKEYAPEMMEHDVKMNLSRYLFPHSMWHKPCSMLSGGEKMKLSLCCLMLDSSQPDMIVLDEPTNNIDLKNIGILVSSIKNYKGTIVLVSHDEHFIHEVSIDYFIELELESNWAKTN